MGKFEVLGYLCGLRREGNDRYLSYTEVHRGMASSGLKVGYASVYRCIHALWCDGLLESSVHGDVVRRVVRFRSKSMGGFQVSGMAEKYSIYDSRQQESSRGSSRAVSLGVGRVPVAVAGRARGVGRG